MHLFTQLNSRALWFLSLSKSCCQEPTSFNGAGHTANTGATGAYWWPGVKVALWLSFIKHQLSLWRDYRAILPQSQHKYLTLSASHYQNPCFLCSIASADHNFPEPDRTSPNGLFCPTNSTKRKDPSVTAWNNKEKQHIVMFKMLEPDNVLTFLPGKWLKTIFQIIKIVGKYIYFNQSIHWLIIAALQLTTSAANWLVRQM